MLPSCNISTACSFQPRHAHRGLREATTQAGGLLSVEPFCAASRPLTEQELKVVCRMGCALCVRGVHLSGWRVQLCAASTNHRASRHHPQDLLQSSCIFSPNLLEAQSMLGCSELHPDPVELALRCGRSPLNPQDCIGSNDECNCYLLEVQSMLGCSEPHPDPVELALRRGRASRHSPSTVLQESVKHALRHSLHAWHQPSQPLPPCHVPRSTVRLLDAGGASGAPLVLVRCGEQGAVAVHGPSGAVVRVPAVPSKVVDVTVSEL